MKKTRPTPLLRLAAILSVNVATVAALLAGFSAAAHAATRIELTPHPTAQIRSQPALSSSAAPHNVMQWAAYPGSAVPSANAFSFHH